MDEQTKKEILDKVQMLLQIAREQGASDVHFAPGSWMMVRVDGGLVPAGEEKFMPDAINEMAQAMLREDQYRELERTGEIDLAHTIPGFGRMRINVFRQRGTYAMAIRILSYEIPDAEALGLPDVVKSLADRTRGLVLVTGATGSGKSTTLAALIHHINMTYSKHIITLEDPIEYLHKHQISLFSFLKI